MIELKTFYRRMERSFGDENRRSSPLKFAVRWLPHLVEDLGEAFGLSTAHLYVRRHDAFSLAGNWGSPCPSIAGDLDERLLAGRPAIEFPWTGVSAAGDIALLELDEDAALVAALFFSRAGSGDGAGARDHLGVLSSLQYAVRQHRRRHELEDLVEQARVIQTSLLPAGPIAFGEYDIAAISVPARRVGGDVFDIIELDVETIAIAVADASGHGLPAALQARDVITGLRMGVERDLKITRTIEKLNRVIHRSGLVTRFISMVFGELESNGNFSYINAGHPPPLLVDDRGVHELTVGGMILGPNPLASYKLGFAHVDRGASLVMYTDGVIEHRNERGEMFGVAGVTGWLTDQRSARAEEAIADLIDRLRAFAPGRFEDDVTAVYLRRPL